MNLTVSACIINFFGGAEFQIEVYSGSGLISRMMVLLNKIMTPWHASQPYVSILQKLEGNE